MQLFMKFHLEENPIPIFLEAGFRPRGFSNSHFIKYIREIPNIEKVIKDSGKAIENQKNTYIHLIITHTYQYFYMCNIHLDIPFKNKSGKTKHGLRHRTLYRHQVLNNEKNRIIGLSFAGKLDIIKNRFIGQLNQQINNKFN